MSNLLDLAKRIVAQQKAAAGSGHDPAEARRQRVLDMLAEHPTIQYAMVTDTESEPDYVIVTLAIRGRATCDLHIPKDLYDGTLLLDLIEKHGATVH
jgi:hypothetical protein